MGVPINNQVAQAKTGKDKATQALIDLCEKVDKLYNAEEENYRILKALYYQSTNKNHTNIAQPVNFTVKNMTDAQLKDLILQGLNFEFIYYLSNRKFSIEYIQQVAQKIK